MSDAPVLRDYQEEAVSAVVDAWQKGHKRVACIIPTQGGKTLTAFVAALDNLRLGVDRAMFIVNRRKITAQTAESISRLFDGLDVGMVMGDIHQFNADVIVGTVQTVSQHLDEILEHGRITYLIVDEAHHAYTNTQYRSIVETLDTRTLFITATVEERHELDLLGVRLAYQATNGQLVRAGILAETVVKYLPMKDAGAVYSTWLHNRPSCGRTIIFAKSVTDSRFIARYFKTMGVDAVAVDAKSDDKARAYAEQQAQVVVNKGLYLEGADLQGVGVVMVLSRDNQATTFVQKIGRAKKADGTGCLVIADSLTVKRLPTEVAPALRSI